MAKAQAKKAVAVKTVSKPRARAKKADTPALPAAKQATPKEMRGKVVALIFNTSAISQHKRIDSSKIEVDAEKDWIGARKKTLASDTLVAINGKRREARRFLRTHALPYLRSDAAYVIPKAEVTRVIEHLTELKAEQAKLVGQLADEWDEVIAVAKKKLRSNFDPHDYPTREGLKNEFAMDWYFQSFDVPVDLEDVNAQLYAEEQAKAEQFWVEGREAWEQLLRVEFQEAVKHLVDVLTPTKDGKLKVFRESALGHLNEFFETFNPRNIADDVQLKALVDKAKGLAKGQTMAGLKDDEHAREMVRASFQTIKNTLEGMVSLKPSREVSFEDD